MGNEYTLRSKCQLKGPLPIIDLYATTYQHFNEVIDPNEVTEKNVTNYYVQKPIYKSIVLTQEIY